MKTSLAQLIKEIAQGGNGLIGVLEARVAGTNPLLVVAVNDEKLRLQGSNLLVPKEYSRHTIKADISGEYGGAVTITMHNELQVGEIVYLLSYNQGGKYAVIGRKQ